MKNIQYTVLLIVIFFSCKKKTPDIPTATNPQIKITDITFSEEGSAEVFFKVTLTGKIESSIFVNYETVAATATAGEDFETTEGALVFSEDETTHTQSIFLQIVDDEKYEGNEYFEIHFSTDASINLTQEKAKITITDNDPQLTDNDFPGYATPMEYDGWNLFWGDEFGGNELNLDDWIQADTGNWYNNELQYYQPDNSVVENGLLTITAKEEWVAGHFYTSSRMWTHHKVFFNYGRLDIRAKLPYSQGLWPALWMMGENRDTVGWAYCGEIDIMELRGHTPNKISSTVHYQNSAGNHQYPTSKKYTLSSGDFSDEFHVFSMIWDADKIQLFVDDNLYNTILHPNFNYYDSDNPFLKDFYILMNVAVGGDFGGNPDATTVWPQTMEVDYVRIFQKE